MKQLTARQIDLIKYPKERGKAKDASSDNYSAVYENTSSAFLYIKSVAELLPYFEDNKDYKKANAVCELFTFENLEPILKSIFTTKKEEGAPLDDRIYFDPSKMNMNKVSSVAYLFKFFSDYLLQAFPEQEYKHLHPRIDELVKDLKSMLDTIRKNQELQRQLDEMRKHLEYHEPPILGVHDRVYDIACIRCRSSVIGKTLKEASEMIKHTEECIAEKNYDEKNPYNWKKWYVINPPTRLLLTWEERRKFDELLKKEVTG